MKDINLTKLFIMFRDKAMKVCIAIIIIVIVFLFSASILSYV